MGVGVDVNGLLDGVLPPAVLHPVHDEQEGVEEEGGESQVAGDRVVEHGPLEGHAEGRPDLGVARDRHEDDGEVRRAHEAHEEGDHPEPVFFFGGGGDKSDKMVKRNDRKR